MCCLRRSSAVTSRDSTNSSPTTSPCGGPERSATTTKIRALKVLRWFIRVTAERSYEVLDRRLFPGGFVQQHILHATGTNGGLIALRVCIVIKLNADNLINRIDEYFDPADLAPILN